MHLHDPLPQLLGDRRHERHLERTGGDHYLVSRVGAVIELHDVTVVLPPHRQDAAVQLDRKIELARIVGEVIRHLVPHRIPVRVAREREARKRVVAGRREQFERVPALAPRRRGLSGGLKDREIATLLGEEVADGEACLAAADDDYVAMLRDGARHDVLI